MTLPLQPAAKPAKRAAQPAAGHLIKGNFRPPEEVVDGVEAAELTAGGLLTAQLTALLTALLTVQSDATFTFLPELLVELRRHCRVKSAQKCASRVDLKNTADWLFACKIGFDTDKNKPSKVLLLYFLVPQMSSTN